MLRAALVSLVLALGVPWAAAQAATPRTGDYIVAVVNQELVTAGEVQQRLAQVREDAARHNAQLPPEAELRRQVTEALIEERVLVTYARDSGVKIDEADLDRAVANVAQQNQISMAQLRERLQREGLDYGRFRSSVRDQLMVERTREREVQSRINVSDAEIDAFLDKQRTRAPVELNLAQILVTVPEGASEIMCHPGYVDDAFAKESIYNFQRLRELHILTDPEIKRTIEAQGIQLITFADL